jgi:hypothetical protein
MWVLLSMNPAKGGTFYFLIFFRWQILKGAHGELKLLQFAGKDGQAAGFLESPLGDASLGYFPGFTEQSTTLCWYLYPILTRDFTFCFTC